VVLVEDALGGQLPETMRESLIVATTSCVAVGCLSEQDGETEFTLGASHEVDPRTHPAFQGVLSTPSRKIRVVSVLGQPILETAVMRDSTTVRIWVNDPTEPDKIIIGVE
jgi:hypothetical protein